MSSQCLGITQKGTPCKLNAKQGGRYCRHHEVQETSEGYIYIYTFKELYENAILSRKERNQISWLAIDESKLNKAKKVGITPWQHQGDEILIKIGMTTRNDVSIRLAEWRKQCKREIIPINPSRALQFYSLDSNTRHGKKSNIIDKVSRLFSKLDLSGGSTSSKTSSTATQTLNLSTYQRNGFRCTHPRDVEREIHEWLWHKYGKGNVLCEACHKTHHEWVRVPVREMVSIMYTIEGICSRSEYAAATSKRERPYNLKRAAEQKTS